MTKFRLSKMYTIQNTGLPGKSTGGKHTMKKRLLAALLCMVMLLALLPTAALADGSATVWTHSKSKTASALTDELESTIKLSLPSAEKPLATDIVLVMDVSMCASNVLPATQRFLQDIYDVQENSNATIKTGIVMFKGNAVPFQPLTVMSQEENTRMQKLFNDLIVPGDTNEAKEATKNAVRAYLKGTEFTDGDGNSYDYANSGTNMPSGLLLAKEMLDNDTDVDASRKYMVLISDGSTYLFTHDGNYTVSYSRSYGPGNYGGGLYESNYIQHDKPSTPPGGYTTLYTQDKTGWTAWLSYVGEHEKDFTQYDFVVDYALLNDGKLPSDATTIPSGTDNYLLNNYTSLYQSAQTFSAMEASGYHCYYSYMFDSEGSQANPMFKAILNADQLIDADASGSHNIFDGIKNDIFYYVGSGSKVVDVIGNDFDFVNDLNKISLTVGKDTLATKRDGNTFYFGTDAGTLDDTNCRFKLVYNETTKTLTWTILETITNLNPVQLSYNVKLTVAEPKDGEKYYTNESATLTPVDSNGDTGDDEEFERPYVIYKKDGVPGGILAGAAALLGLDTDDHIAYVYGYPDGTVRPDGTITRAEVTTIFYRLLTAMRRDEIFTAENSFKDVDASKWYNKAASSMANGGYITGYSDGTFGADKPITRAEFVAIASRFASKTTGFASYSDVDNGHWAAKAIAVCAANGWVQGYEDGTFRPDRPITRAEAMTIINRMLNRGVSKGYICKGATRFADNTADSWYYFEVIEATNDHEYHNARPFEQWVRASIVRSYDIDKYERP